MMGDWYYTREGRSNNTKAHAPGKSAPVRDSRVRHPTRGPHSIRRENIDSGTSLKCLGTRHESPYSRQTPRYLTDRKAQHQTGRS